jgi:hypothetical protein
MSEGLKPAGRKDRQKKLHVRKIVPCKPNTQTQRLVVAKFRIIHIMENKYDDSICFNAVQE